MEKDPQKENSNKDEIDDLKITRKQKLVKTSIENKNNDESDVIEQKNLRFSDKWIWKSDKRKP